MEKPLPDIPAKRYFAIGEVSELCAVKPYVLRYWEQEFAQLRPMKRRGNRRYYQHHEVLLVRRIRELLYDRGFTIHGARGQLADAGRERDVGDASEPPGAGPMPTEVATPLCHRACDQAVAVLAALPNEIVTGSSKDAASTSVPTPLSAERLRHELRLIRRLLTV